MRITNCRMCKSSNLQKFLDLGFSALSDNFLTIKQLEESESFFPLTVYLCSNCGLCQLGYVVPPKFMFNKDYPYDSSTTKMGREHFTKMGVDISDRFNLKENSLVIDVGSNSGVLLSAFKSKGMRVLGIEPSSKLANAAIEKGVDTIIDFFSGKLVEKILDDYQKVSVITGTNVFAHINDLDDFMLSADSLLVEDGIIMSAAQEERFTRIKHDASFPVNAIKFCLESSSLTLDDIDSIVFYEKPLLKFERLLETYVAFAPAGFSSFKQAIPTWVKDKLFLPQRMRKELKKIPGKYNNGSTGSPSFQISK